MDVLFAGSHSTQAPPGPHDHGGISSGKSALNVRWLGAGRGAAGSGPRNNNNSSTSTGTAAPPPSSYSSSSTPSVAMSSRVPSASPHYTDRGATSWTEDLYEAETWSEGMRAMFRVVPKWVPAAGLLSALALYYAAFRVRLFIAQWRIAERRKAERKYALLDNLRGVQMRAAAGAAEALADDDNDEEEEEDDDETAVSMRDIDEFRSSLGIRLPRDEDLLGIVECMLLVDPIPDGWVLYRTTAGIIRFMNLNTQELFFFHPNKRREKAYIESELKRRNRQAIESKYTFFYEDDNHHLTSNVLLNAANAAGSAGAAAAAAAAASASTRDGGKASAAALTAGGSGGGGARTLSNACEADASAGGNSPSTSELVGGPSPSDFGSDAASDAPLADESQSSAFKRIFHYFVEKEQRRIEQEVARARNARENSVGSAAMPNTNSSTNSNNNSNNNNSATMCTNAGPMGGTGAAHGPAANAGSGTTPTRAPALSLSSINAAGRAGRAGSMETQGTPRRQPASATCRVVPSSTIHGSRGASTANVATM